LVPYQQEPPTIIRQQKLTPAPPTIVTEEKPKKLASQPQPLASTPAVSSPVLPVSASLASSSHSFKNSPFASHVHNSHYGVAIAAKTFDFAKLTLDPKIHRSNKSLKKKNGK